MNDLAQKLSTEQLQELRSYLEILKREREWSKSNERIKYFEPNGKQEEFIRLFATGTRDISIFSASNSLGKTTLIVNLLGNLVFGPQNKFFDYEIFKNWPYPKRVRFITDPKLVEEIAPFQTEIDKWWPKRRYEPIKSGKTYYSQYRANGWIIDVMSYDQKPTQFEGSTLGLALFDEPPPEDLWTPTIRGLRGRGKAGVFMTPLTHAGWFYDKVVPEYQDAIVYGAMEDGCKIHGIRGHLDHEAIQNQIKHWMMIAPEQVEARAYGKAMYLQGQIFKTFDANVHVLKENINCPPHIDCWQIVDPHDDKPFAVTYAFPDQTGTIYIHDEWPNDDFYKMHNCQLNVDDYVKLFKDKEQSWHMGKRIMDRRFGEVSHTTNRKTLRDDFQERGLLYEQSYSASEEIETGILKVRQYLAYDKSKPIDNLNHPKIYINPKCKNTIKSLSMWSRDPDSGKVQEAYKDFCDNLRYLVMANPRQAEQIQRPMANKYG